MDDSLAGLTRSVQGGLIAAKLADAELAHRGKARPGVGHEGAATASRPRRTVPQRVARELRRAATSLLRPFLRRHE